ncbi:hypothetical protein [Aeromonas phage AS-yj]|uniref:Uncharacterized protein n=6 Tax=Caudoviricetes TaxID=2731619 RepID=A0A291LEW9_9CAUD|nr:hypothetical protein HWB28_gp109 [Aeromonas phage AS-zj]YP_009835044.1 hypothetical protein HWB29_gp342 [Aeromonas phage AS-sw]ATI17554.1 hypothetical protein [Aeromonas phage AS-szw]ATI17954.1 hypothetical protein [Aeromonas phage AS-yj]QAX97994.1 hypothetical protein ASswx1_354 [Aeromonas phage Asswx_1]QAX98963.1 hypothetical protein assk_171 [Aeromonas phage Assk]QMV28921.1 hypothetical protein AP1_0214 [Aeromonas phage AP1]UKM62620.1 hypothetical protein P19_0132 [Aeromonas phage P19]
MWLINMFYKMFRFVFTNMIPFLLYFAFWALNVHTMIYIPGAPNEVYLRFVAAVLFPFGVVWGMVDAVMLLI